MRLLKKLLVALCICVVAYGVTIVGIYYFKQEEIIFPAPVASTDSAEDDFFKTIRVQTGDGEDLFGLHHAAENNEPTILIFHGNRGAAIYQKKRGLKFVLAGYGVLLVEYRGYPGSTGTPSQDGFHEDARTFYDFLASQNKQPIGIYAHSLGTAVAIRLASERKVSATVLESPFDSILAVAEDRFPFFPVRYFLKHKFESYKYIGKVDAPLMIVHGSKDIVIPIKHARNLLAYAPPDTRFVEIKNADHNNLDDFGSEELAIEFLDEHLKP